MRDVIVVGAGGGGAGRREGAGGARARRAAARGRPAVRRARARVDPLRERRQQPGQGLLALRAGRPRGRRGSRELPQNSCIWQVAGVGGTRCTTSANSPRAMPGAFRGYAGPTATPTTRAPVPLRLPRARALLRVGRGDAARADGRDGHEGGGLPPRRARAWACRRRRPKDITARLVPPAGERHPPAARDRRAGPTTRAAAGYPLAQGCTFCGHCVAGLHQAAGAPRNLKAKRSTDNSYVPMALTADRWAGGKAVTLVRRRLRRPRRHRRRRARGAERDLARRGDRRAWSPRRPASSCWPRGAVETPRLWLNSGLPNPNGWVGRGLTDHAIDLVVGGVAVRRRGHPGTGVGRARRLPGAGRLRADRAPRRPWRRAP